MAELHLIVAVTGISARPLIAIHMITGAWYPANENFIVNYFCILTSYTADVLKICTGA